MQNAKSPMTKLHILVTEDDELARRGLCLILERAGAKVSLVTNGQEALDLIVANLDGDEPVNFLVFDLIMPVLSGIELIDALAERDIRLPALAVTGAVDARIISEIRARGYGDFVEKPFDGHQLLDKIAEVLQKGASGSDS